MSDPDTDRWSSVRNSFADQFEKSGSDFIYRKSQKGEAFRVTASERDRFLDEFSGNLRRATWFIYVSVLLALGLAVVMATEAGKDSTAPITMGALLIAMVPYLLYFRWAWAAPARELSGRIPIAGKRSSDEVRRIRLGHLRYSQLAVGALGGLAFPFAISRGDPFSGWNQVSWVGGAALVTLCAVQAFRKWQVEKDDPYLDMARVARVRDISQAPESNAGQMSDQLWRFLPLAIMLVALPLLALTPIGKRLVQTPSFWSIAMVGLGAWTLFSVWRGLTKGRIEPFVRGVSSTYERETQPKRFWASVAWNSILGCFLLWVGSQMNGWDAAQPIRDRCYNQSSTYSPRDVISACDELIAGKVPLDGWTRADVLVDRGLAYRDLGQLARAVGDFDEAIRLKPHYPEAYFDRALAYQDLHHVTHALSDYGTAIQQNPKDSDSYFDRGLIYLDQYKFDEAIADLSRAHDLNPKDPWALANRGLAYAWKNDPVSAQSDFEIVKKTDPKNLVMIHGEAVLSINAGNLERAEDLLTTALKVNPRDSWSLQTRADAYQQAGDFAKAQADRDQLKQLAKTRSSS